MLSGEIPPSGGRVELLGEDVTRWTQPKRAQAWAAATSATPSTPVQRVRELPPRRAGGAPRSPNGSGGSRRGADAPRRSARLHREGRADGPARAPGRRCSATARSASSRSPCAGHRAQVLLLDEPLAGMGAEETERMLMLLAELLKPDHAILLVEHDMDAVFRIADRITVMVNGCVIASDGPGGDPRNRTAAWPTSGTEDRRTMITSRCSKRRPACLVRLQPRAARRRLAHRRAARRSACWAATAWAEHADPHAARPRAAARGPHRLLRPGCLRPARTGGAPGRGLRARRARRLPNLTVRENLLMAARPAATGAATGPTSACCHLPRLGRSASRTSAPSSPAASSRCCRSAAR